MGEREMVEQLLDFNIAEISREEAVISWKALAFEVGVSKATLQRWCIGKGIELPHWGPADQSPVFLPRGKIVILKTLYFA